MFAARPRRRRRRLLPCRNRRESPHPAFGHLLPTGCGEGKDSTPHPALSPVEAERVVVNRRARSDAPYLANKRAGRVFVRLFECEPCDASGSGGFFAIEEALQMTDARRMTELTQRFRFDLADAFAGDVVHLADLFERAFITIHETETHFENLAFAFGKSGQHVGRIFRALVFDEITNAHIAIVTDSIALARLMELLFVCLTREMRLNAQDVAETLWRDAQRAGRNEKPPFLREFIPDDRNDAPRGKRSSLKRQSRHATPLISEAHE